MRKTVAVPQIIPGNEAESSLMLERRIARGHIGGVTTGKLLVTGELPSRLAASFRKPITPATRRTDYAIGVQSASRIISTVD